VDNWWIEIRVVWEDLPDMVELETRVRAGEWSALSRAYALPDFLAGDAERLIAWARNPHGRFRLDAGADTGIGWLVLEFYTIDSAGHARCAVTLATGGTSREARPAETWRFAIEIKTEPGLIERFGQERIWLGRDRSGTARLSGLPTYAANMPHSLP
jgi:hypothetical protein